MRIRRPSSGLLQFAWPGPLTEARTHSATGAPRLLRARRRVKPSNWPGWPATSLCGGVSVQPLLGGSPRPRPARAGGHGGSRAGISAGNCVERGHRTPSIRSDGSWLGLIRKRRPLWSLSSCSPARPSSCTGRFHLLVESLGPARHCALDQAARAQPVL